MFRRLHQFFGPAKSTLMLGTTSTQLASTRSLITYSVHPTKTADAKPSTTHYQISVESSDKPLSEQDLENRLQAFCEELRRMRLRAATIEVPVEPTSAQSSRRVTAIVVEAKDIPFKDALMTAAEHVERQFEKPENPTNPAEKKISPQR